MPTRPTVAMVDLDQFPTNEPAALAFVAATFTVTRHLDDTDRSLIRGRTIDRLHAIAPVWQTRTPAALHDALADAALTAAPGTLPAGPRDTATVAVVDDGRWSLYGNTRHVTVVPTDGAS